MSPQPNTPSPEPRVRRPLAMLLLLTGVFLALGFISRGRTNPHLAWTFCGVAGFLAGWQLVLFLVTGRNKPGLRWEFVPVPSHYVQATVQFAIYVYWGWYWREVYTEAPLILSQVVFFYIFDALLTWSRGQPWRLGFGPWPIIFSTNLFLWFRDDWYVFQFLMVATGVLAKHFIRWRRDGKITHIFNPSAFALTLFSLVLICTKNTGCTWGEPIALTQGLPPYLYTEIFLCGLVVQYFFLVTLMTFSAAAALGLLSLLYLRVTGVYLFIDSNIPIAVFLGLHLLMTDPATTPRSSLGKILFGSLYGAGVFGAYIVLDVLGAPTFYDKLLLVPLLNLLTPLLDRLAGLGVMGRFGRWEMLIGQRKMNLAYMGGWVALFLVMLATGFVQAPHPGSTLGFWWKAAEEKRPRAVANLRLILDRLTREDLDDPSKPVGNTSATGPLNREQAIGILDDQIGSIYAEGKFVPTNSAEAIHYFLRGCEHGNPDACTHLAIEYLFSERLETQAGMEQALATLEQTCLQSTNGLPSFLVGYAYDVGRGHPVDKAKARKFYGQAAALGDLNAYKNLARMQLNGEGGPPDHAAAALWLQKAADLQDGQSCLYLARLYHNGDGVPRDEQRAKALLEQACNLGVQPACILLQQARP
jgi:TPR repeat protein